MYGKDSVNVANHSLTPFPRKEFILVFLLLCFAQQFILWPYVLANIMLGVPNLPVK